MTIPQDKRTPIHNFYPALDERILTVAICSWKYNKVIPTKFRASKFSFELKARQLLSVITAILNLGYASGLAGETKYSEPAMLK